MSVRAVCAQTLHILIQSPKSPCQFGGGWEAGVPAIATALHCVTVLEAGGPKALGEQETRKGRRAGEPHTLGRLDFGSWFHCIINSFP